MNLFDLHCDTATRLLAENQGIYNNDFHVSLKKAKRFDSYAQVMAVWTHHKLSDAQGYTRFFEVVKNLEKEIKINCDTVGLARDSAMLNSLLSQNKCAFILSIEDARILENDLSRLDTLYSHGVRMMTLNWYGETCIGGAHDTHVGLTDFGVEAVKKCFDLGIIPDISHSSFEGAEMVLELAQSCSTPIVASHSDSYSVNPHTRNLRDKDFTTIKNLGGLVGINLCPEHLSLNHEASSCDVIKHIEHYLSLGGENTLAFGCDLDGTNLPNGFSSISDLEMIAEELQKLNYSNELIEKITFKNALEFFNKNL